MGSMGNIGRGFLADLRQADPAAIGSALLGGVVFNAANILLVAAIALAGMAVAFPVGIGLALVLGVLINYFGGDSSANASLLFLGVALIAAAIILDALAYRKLSGSSSTGSSGSGKGLVLSILCGVLMSLFYFLVARAIGQVEIHTAKGVELAAVTAQSLHAGAIQAGKMTAYTANVVFAFGILLSSFVFNTAIMKKPFRRRASAIGRLFYEGPDRRSSLGHRRRCHLGGRHDTERCCLGQGQPCSRLRSGPGRHDGRRALGRFYMARISQCPARHFAFINIDVFRLFHRLGAGDFVTIKLNSGPHRIQGAYTLRSPYVYSHYGYRQRQYRYGHQRSAFAGTG